MSRWGAAILDGRNRFRACEEAGVEARFEAYVGDDPLGYVISLNVCRRHLDESQRAIVAAKIATMKQGARTDLASIEARSQTETAELLNVSRSGVQRAREVIDHGAPALIAAVEQGEIAGKDLPLRRRRRRDNGAVQPPESPFEGSDGSFRWVRVKKRKFRPLEALSTREALLQA